MAFALHRSRLVLAGLLLALSAAGAGAGYNYTDKEREARWQDLRSQIFGTRTVTMDESAITLDAPETAVDAALVPLSIAIAHPGEVKALTLVIDDNPSPLAARFTFGPAADPKTIKLRVRINHLTDVHAIVETRDGRLLQSTRFVKASGGCSAPMGVSDEEAMRGMGEMKLQLAGDIVPGKPADATLMIRHPNFNGMQMNEAAQVFTPARFIKTIDVRLGDKQVFSLATDISLASNPVISFALLLDKAKSELAVDVKDSKGGAWTRRFPVPPVGN